MHGDTNGMSRHRVWQREGDDDDDNDDDDDDDDDDDEKKQNKIKIGRQSTEEVQFCNLH